MHLLQISWTLCRQHGEPQIVFFFVWRFWTFGWSLGEVRKFVSLNNKNAIRVYSLNLFLILRSPRISIWYLDFLLDSEGISRYVGNNYERSVNTRDQIPLRLGGRPVIGWTLYARDRLSNSGLVCGWYWVVALSRAFTGALCIDWLLSQVLKEPDSNCHVILLNSEIYCIVASSSF